jgi:hypothetical protein
VEECKLLFCKKIAFFFTSLISFFGLLLSKNCKFSTSIISFSFIVFIGFPLFIKEIILKEFHTLLKLSSPSKQSIKIANLR